MTQDAGQETHRFLLPITGLTLTTTWDVGTVRLHPAGSTRDLVAAARSTRSSRNVDWFDRHVDEESGARLSESTVADVTAAEIRQAYRQVADAIAILRLFQRVQAPMVDTDWQTFGLPGELAPYTVEYIDLSSGPGPGWYQGGPAPGWTFSDKDRRDFEQCDWLQFLAEAVGREDGSVLQQRGLLGTRLLTASTLEQDPDKKLLSAISALEVLLGTSDKGTTKKLRLARRHAFLACSVPAKSMCGRDRDSCPYLALDPDVHDERERLLALRRVGPPMYCSEYYRIIDLYEARNRAAHEGTVGADLKDVRNELYPLYRWLVPQLFSWYVHHKNDPDLRELDVEIKRTVDARPWVP